MGGIAFNPRNSWIYERKQITKWFDEENPKKRMTEKYSIEMRDSVK